MDVVDRMAALSIFNAGGALNELPLRSYTTTDATNGVALTDKNYVLITGIVVLDENVDSAANLTPAKTTYTPSAPGNGGSSNGSSGGGSGGGSMEWASLLMLLALLGIGRSRR
jgi:peptidyl-prolyl cis-trans isomerase A (cyclophilin A)